VKRLVVLTAAILGCGDPAAVVIDEGTPVDTPPEFAPIQIFGAPVPEPTAISSTFGPRWKASDDRDDFHLGIDYYGTLGTRVVAIGEGTVSATYVTGEGPFPNAGNVVVVEHELPRGRMFHGRPVTRFYAVYLHLDTITVVADDPVIAGDQVGTMGMTGDTDFVHLHFETRIETVCSLPFQLANPGLGCATGFDPHVHPFVFVGGQNDDAIRVEEVTGVPGFVVRYTATRGDLDLDVIEADGGALGFNQRIGIDASSVPALDSFTYGFVELQPLDFLSTSSELVLEIRFRERPEFLELRDIFGRGIRFDSH
jgi:hypothetical protein